MVAVFHDIKKASAKEHVLVCSKEHIDDIFQLKKRHITLVERMKEVGESELEKL